MSHQPRTQPRRSPAIAASLLATTLLAAAVAAPAIAGTDDSGQREQVEIRKVIVASDGSATDGAAGRTVMVKRRVVGDAAPITSVTLIPEEGAAPLVFEIEELEVGETRTVESSTGALLDVTRTEAGLSLDVDGDVIDIPLPSMGGDLLNGIVVGDQDVHVVRRHGDPSDPGANAFVWVSEHGDGAVTTGEGDHVFIHAGVPAGLQALRSDAGTVDFDQLETLKGLEPDVREKVIAALREILAAPTVMEVVVTGAPNEGSADETPDRPTRRRRGRSTL